MPLIISYRDVRGPVISYTTDRNCNVKGLVIAEQMFLQRSAGSSQGALRQNYEKQSIEVLNAIQAMNDQLGGIAFSAVSTEQPKLEVSGITVSVRLNMFVHCSTRGVEQVGGGVLRMTQDDAETDGARARRKEMGLYVATIASLHLEPTFALLTPIANKLCMSVDIRHGKRLRRLNQMLGA